MSECAVFRLLVCPARSDSVHAGQVPAWLRVPASRQDIPRSHLHRHPDRVLSHHVVHQEHPGHIHHISAHGKTRKTLEYTESACWLYL